MDDDLAKLVGSVFLAIIGVAIVAVIVSNSASTSSVIQAATSGFAQDLQVAVSPVTGSSGISNTLNSLASNSFSGLLSNGTLL